MTCTQSQSIKRGCGLSQQQPSDTGLTFLFTDIKDSAKLWERNASAMEASLARHDGLLRSAIESHRGQVFKSMGDAFFAVFETATDAASAALAAQRALRVQLANPAIRVRMALHRGPVFQRDGDYFGPTLNRAARLLALGHADQILVSSAAAERLLGDLPDRATLRSLGTFQLKGLREPERVFQLIHASVPSIFPILRVGRSLAHRLTPRACLFSRMFGGRASHA